MPGEMLVHLEHGHLVLAEDALELVVGQDLAAVLRVLQVVGLDVVPHLAHHLAPGQRSWADHRSQRLGGLQRPLQRVRLAATCGGLRRFLRLRCPGWHCLPPICAAILARAAPDAVHGSAESSTYLVEHLDRDDRELAIISALLTAVHKLLANACPCPSRAGYACGDYR